MISKKIKIKISSGGYGSVFSANNDMVAIKVIKIGVGFTNRYSFDRECKKFRQKKCLLSIISNRIFSFTFLGAIIYRVIESPHKNMLEFHEVLFSPFYCM